MPWSAISRHAILIAFCVVILFPLCWVLLESFKSLPDSVHRYIWPHDFVSPWYANFERAFRKRSLVIHNLRNSVMVTGGTVVLTTFTSVLAGYALAHLKLPGKRFVVGVLVASTFFPTRVTALIGIYNVQDALGLINKTWGLMLPYTALSTAVSVFIMRGVFQGVPRDIMDSSRIDGASSFRTLTGIMLPLVRNGIVVVIIININFAWGEYVLAQTLMNQAANKTLPVFLVNSSGGLAALSRASVSALYVLAIAPSLIFFAIAQHWYMKGLQEGALKT